MTRTLTGMKPTFRSQISVLAAMQVLLLVNNATLVTANGLAGFSLADNKLLATLPVTGYVLGGALWAMPAAAFMKRYGRRAGYGTGSLAAMVGALMAWQAVTLGSLALLCVSTFVCGLYNAFSASLRFAAADVADAHRPDWRARAISLVLSAGIIGGIIGPELSKWSRTWLAGEFSGTYLTLAGFGLLSLLLSRFLDLPAAPVAAASGEVRPLREILADPVLRLAILASAIAYGVMNLLMVATPLAMAECRHPYTAAALVLELHVTGMFLPGLFTGSLIQRFGALRVMATGAVLLLACTVVALTGVEISRFAVAMILLGVGWNFLYTSGSTLLTTRYRPAEKNRVQGFTDFCVFSVMVTSSAASGAMLITNGWNWLNLLSLPFPVLVLIAIWRISRTPPRAAA